MTVEWKILELKRIIYSGLVTEIYYQVIASEGRFKSFYGDILKLEGDEYSSEFIPFENLSQEIVLDWIKLKLGSDKISQILSELETKLNTNIEIGSNQTTSFGFPWSYR